MSIDHGDIAATDPSFELNDRFGVASAIMEAIKKRVGPPVTLVNDDEGEFWLMSLEWNGPRVIHLQATTSVHQRPLVFFIITRSPGITGDIEDVQGEWVVDLNDWGAAGSQSRSVAIERFVGEIVAVLGPILSQL